MNDRERSDNSLGTLKQFKQVGGFYVSSGSLSSSAQGQILLNV